MTLWINRAYDKEVHKCQDKSREELFIGGVISKYYLSRKIDIIRKNYPSNAMNNKNQFAWAIGHDPLVVPMFLSLEIAHKVANIKAREIWSQHDLTPAEFDVLVTLRNSPTPHELTPGEIQDRVLITSGGLTKVIVVLEQKRLIKRSVNKNDSRVKPVRLTAAGNRFISKAMRHLADMSGVFIRSILSDSEIKQVTHALNKIVEAHHA